MLRSRRDEMSLGRIASTVQRMAVHRLRIKVPFPKRLSFKSTATMAVALRTSSAGFSSTTSKLTCRWVFEPTSGSYPVPGSPGAGLGDPMPGAMRSLMSAAGKPSGPGPCTAPQLP